MTLEPRWSLNELPKRTNTTSTVSGAGFATCCGRAAAALRGAADGSRSTASKPANASTRTTSEMRIPGETGSPRKTKRLLTSSLTLRPDPTTESVRNPHVDISP